MFPDPMAIDIDDQSWHWDLERDPFKGVGIWMPHLGCPGGQKKCWDESMVIGSVGYIFITPIYPIK